MHNVITEIPPQLAPAISYNSINIYTDSKITKEAKLNAAAAAIGVLLNWLTSQG